MHVFDVPAVLGQRLLLLRGGLAGGKIRSTFKNNKVELVTAERIGEEGSLYLSEEVLGTKW